MRPTRSAPDSKTPTRSQGVLARANSRTTAMPTKLLTNREDPPEADLRTGRRGRPAAAFQRPEADERDARDTDFIPDWHRPPTDWREEHDIIVGAQITGLTPPRANRRQPLRAPAAPARRRPRRHARPGGNDTPRQRLEQAPVPLPAKRSGQQLEDPAAEQLLAGRHAHRDRRPARDPPDGPLVHPARSRAQPRRPAAARTAPARAQPGRSRHRLQRTPARRATGSAPARRVPAAEEEKRP